MRKLSQTATKVFTKLFQICDANNGHVKIHNDTNFMPVTVEKIDENERFDFYSVAHYYEQNGDLIADPEITFAVLKDSRDPENQKYFKHFWIYPNSYKMDGFGIDQNDFILFGEDGNPKNYRGRRMTETANFCTTWAKNIKEQQNIK